MFRNLIGLFIGSRMRAGITAALLAGLFLFTPIHTLFLAGRLLDDVPSQDDVAFFAVEHIENGLHLKNLFAFFNEHIPVFTRIAIYADYRLLDGTKILPSLLNLLMVLGCWGVFCAVFRRAVPAFSQRQFLFLSGLLLTLYLNGRMLEDLTFPPMVQPWAAFGAAAAFAVFSRVPEQIESGPREPRLGLLSATIVAAALTCAGGLLAGASMLGVFAVLIRPAPDARRRFIRFGMRLLGIVCLIVAVYAGAFLAARGGHEHSVSDLSSIVRFVYVFVGGPYFNDSNWPIVSQSSPLLLYSVCAVFWALLVWLGAQLLKRRRQITSFELFHACVIVFVILNALAGGVLRSDLAMMEGLSKKYSPIALMAWLSAASLLAFYRPNLFFREKRVRVPAVLACAALVLVLIPGDLLQYRMWRVWRAQVRQAAAAAASGVYDSDLLPRLYYQPEVGYATRQFAQMGKYCYRRMPPPGYRLRDRFTVTGPERVESLQADVSSVRDRPNRACDLAWGTGAEFNDAFPALVVADHDDRVLGYGTVSDVSFTDGARQRTGVWFAAFQAPASGSGLLRVYQVRGRSATQWGTLEVEAAPELDAALKASSKPLPGVADNRDFTLDLFNGVREPSPDRTTYVPESGTVDLTGWAVDRNADSPAAAVDIMVDGSAFPAQTGRRREDVSSYFRRPHFANSGFTAQIPAATIGPGQHYLSVRIYVAAGASYLESPEFRFDVEK